MKTQINSEITDTINLFASLNGMTIHVGQNNQEIKMSIDQAATLAVEILTHVDQLAKKNLGENAPKFIDIRK